MRWLTCLLVIPGSVQFNDVGQQAGLTARNVSGDELRKKYIIEMNGSGVAFFDYNNDGYVDLFVVNGTRWSLPPGEPAPTNHLYRNNGDGTFTDVTDAAGLIATGWGQGACAGESRVRSF